MKIISGRRDFRDRRLPVSDRRGIKAFIFFLLLISVRKRTSPTLTCFYQIIIIKGFDWSFFMWWNSMWSLMQTTVISVWRMINKNIFPHNQGNRLARLPEENICSVTPSLFHQTSSMFYFFNNLRHFKDSFLIPQSLGCIKKDKHLMLSDVTPRSLSSNLLVPVFSKDTSKMTRSVYLPGH